MVSSLKKKLQPRSARRASCYALIGVVFSILLLASNASAVNQIIKEPTDFWFDYTQPTLFIAETFMSDGYPSDPQLWLYDEQGQLLISNDDHAGLQSFISIEVQAGRYRLRAGTCCWQPDEWRVGQGWNEQYELAFNGDPASTTTLEPLPTTTLEPLPTTTLPPTTTTEEPTTTTSSTTTTTTSTTTTTLLASTTSSSTTTSSTTTSTTEPTTTTTTSASTTSSTSPTPTTTASVPIQTTSTTSTLPPTTTTIPPTTTTIPVTQQAVSASQAAEIATNPEALATATAEEATEVFQALELDTLTDTQLDELVTAVQSAPPEVRASFEEEINIFGGKADSYVPLGSTIPVRERRALIVITTVMFAAPIASRKKW